MLEFYQKEMKATIRAVKEKIRGLSGKGGGGGEGQRRRLEVTIETIQSMLEETIKHQVEDALAPVDQRTQGLCDELNKNNEQMQLGLQAIMISLVHRIQGAEINVQTTKTLVETMQHGFKAKIAGVTDSFTKGLYVKHYTRPLTALRTSTWSQHITVS